ncbi:MAG: BT_3987 domain-containing protein [Candidatus Cryptobacteroides sp.]
MNFKSFFLSLSAALLAVTAMTSCEQKVQENDTLSVEPSSSIEFDAKDNESVRLIVTTTASEWTYTAPEWIEAAAEGNVLVVNAKENTTGDERIGRIVFNAGNAEPVKITVSQLAGKEGPDQPVTGDKVAVKLTSDDETLNILTKAKEEITLNVTLSIEEAVAYPVEVELFVDKDHLSEYNYVNKVETVLFPEDKITLSQSNLVINAGETQVSTTVTIDPSELGFATSYLVPLYVKNVRNAQVKQSACRVNYTVLRQNDREVKNVVYIEVNDCNPLNCLEYVLEDGTPFFDAVILFAANINYNSKDDVVYLNNNRNVQALLDETDVYLQPLRKAGIKVYLGLLGNHDAAGLAQLSDWGAREWAAEVAEACKTYKLDGVNLDDEYSNGPDLSSKWFTNRSAAAGARLMYELKVALKEACPWPTEVSFFDWGSLYNIPEVDGHPQSEFIDFHVANYGSASGTFGDLTLKQCSGTSIQLNYGNSISESTATGIKNNGYGWIMWFAFDPSGTGSVSNNRTHSVTQFNNVARGCYGQGLKTPTGVYNKIGEGKYDPKRYAL